MSTPNLSLPNGFISPWLEMGAYEALWTKTGASFKTIADKFRAQPSAIPSDFVQHSVAKSFARNAIEILQSSRVGRFGVRVHGACEYPEKLREAEHPIELLYYQGWWDLAESPCVAVVGTRKPTKQGIARTKKLVKHLIEDGFTVVSGLARGIDTVVHKTAIERGGLTIGIIGTPLSRVYPSENKKLQQQIASEYLLISQVPVVRYSRQGPKQNRMFFPARNITMSALTEATIIVEASETSGTLTQARAAIHQGRKLFILDSCFRDKSLTWPSKYEKRGATRVRDYQDIRSRIVN
jgi:DNA processing protein